MPLRVAYFVALLIASWIVMTLTHELGHLLGGWLGGAQLESYELAPWRLPYSFHDPNPRPLLTLWAGPVLGGVGPLAAAAVIRRRWAWFVADFCLLANGIYLALAWFSGDSTLDTSQLLEAGAHPLSITAFSGVSAGVGYFRFRKDCISILAASDKPAC
jgi:hypothetical protein